MCKINLRFFIADTDFSAIDTRTQRSDADVVTSSTKRTRFSLKTDATAAADGCDNQTNITNLNLKVVLYLFDNYSPNSYHYQDRYSTSRP